MGICECHCYMKMDDMRQGEISGVRPPPTDADIVGKITFSIGQQCEIVVASVIVLV